MLNFRNISPIADFYSKIDTDLQLINKNVLYCTHELDKIKKIVVKLENSLNLQKQVDNYFEEDIESDVRKETSPQTDTVEQ